jgi:hypothetical protein
MGRIGWTAGPLTWALAALPALAQAEGQERAQELERQKQLQDRIIPPEYTDESYFDFGGWFRPQYYQFRDGTDRVRARQDYDFRLWLDLRHGGVHTVFFRGMYHQFYWDQGDGPTGEEDKGVWRIDVAYYQLDLSSANELGAREPVGYLRLGRLYHQLGTGIAFNGNFDGGMLGFNFGPVGASVFGGRSIYENDDLDRSRPGSLVSRRFFYCGLIEGNFSSEITPYVFYLLQRDDNDEDPEAPGQEFEWNSEYLGAGLRAFVFTPNVTASIEWISESGHRFAHLATVSQEHIVAQALYAQIGYRMGIPMAPQAKVTYMYASGDGDRIFVPNTFLGNAINTTDNCFTAFGYIPTGYLFNPILANLKVYHAGVSFQPIYPEGLSLMQVEVGVDLYGYAKDKRRGGISDPFMRLQSHDVGWELDVFANLTFFSDFAIYIRYGIFKPGDEPMLRDERHFFLIGSVFSF